MDINTTLLRERFTLTDLEDGKSAPVVATSNRIALALRDKNGRVLEQFVIRAQNMHSAIRMAQYILMGFQRTGPILARTTPFPFSDVLQRITPDHDVSYNPLRWVAVYSKGKIVFSSGDHHGFLDVIERCDSINPGNYDHAVTIAEDTFHKMGKELNIQHESNIGMVINVKVDSGRCGLILRNPHKTTTFNFVAEPKNNNEVTPLSCLDISACLLEGVQLAVRVGMINERLKTPSITKSDNEENEAHSAVRRLAELTASIDETENRLDIRYRPEKPDFQSIIREAEQFQRRILMGGSL